MIRPSAIQMIPPPNRRDSLGPPGALRLVADDASGGDAPRSTANSSAASKMAGVIVANDHA